MLATKLKALTIAAASTASQIAASTGQAQVTTVPAAPEEQRIARAADAKRPVAPPSGPGALAAKSLADKTLALQTLSGGSNAPIDDSDIATLAMLMQFAQPLPESPILGVAAPDDAPAPQDAPADVTASKATVQSDPSAQDQATADREGLASARAVAGFKALLADGAIKLDGKGSISFERNKLTRAEFIASLKAVLPNVEIDASVDTTWTPEGIVTEAKLEELKATFGTLELNAQNDLVLKPGGKIDDDLTVALSGTFGPGIAINSDDPAQIHIELKDSHFVSASVSGDFTKELGPNASVETELKATITREGIESGELMAAYKAFFTGAQLKFDGSGKIVIVNNSLNQAAFHVMIEKLMGKDAVKADFDAVWSPPNGTFDLRIQQFLATVGKLHLTAQGALEVDKTGQVNGTLTTDLADTFGRSVTVSADNVLVFQHSAFVSDKLKAEVRKSFGSAGSLDATIQATFTQQGLQEATLFGAVKTVVGGAEHIEGTAKIHIAKDKIDQVAASISLIAGEPASPTLKADGSAEIDLDQLGRFKDGKFLADFTAVMGATTLTGDGKLVVDAGKLQGQADLAVRHVFGGRAGLEKDAPAIGGKVQLTFDDTGLKPSDIEASLDLTGLKGTNISADFRDHNGAIEGKIAIGAVQRLKQLARNGGDGQGIVFNENGTVEIKGDRISRAEVAALVSATVNQHVEFDTDGHLVYADGRIAGDVTQQMKLTFDNTTLNAKGKLSWVDGKPKLDSLGAQFGNAKFQAGAEITVDADETRVDLSAKTLTGNALLNGSLVFEKRHLSEVSASTSIVIGSSDKPTTRVTGLVAIKKGDAKFNVDAEVKAGVFSGVAGVSASVNVKPHVLSDSDDDDAYRKALGKGYQEWNGTFDVHASGGIDVQEGMVHLGVSAGAEKKMQATAITVGDGKAEAPLVTIMKPPRSFADMSKFQEGEAWIDEAEHTFRIEGSAGFGAQVGKFVGVTASADLSHNVHGSLKRKFLLKEGRFIVQFQKGKGDLTVETFSVGAKIQASDGVKLPGGALVNAAAQKALPLLQQFGKIDLERQFQQANEGDVLFEIVFDPQKPGTADAFTQLALDHFGRAQALAADPNSGVVIVHAVRTETKERDSKGTLSIGPDGIVSVNDWVDKKTQSFDAKGIEFEGITQGDAEKTVKWPGLKRDWTSNVELVHRQTLTVAKGKSDKLGQIESVTSIGRPFTEGDTDTMISYVLDNLNASSKPASLGQLKHYLDGVTAVLDSLGVPKDQRGSFGELAQAVNDKKVPKKHGFFDKRFGAVSLQIQSVITKRGLGNVLASSHARVVQAFTDVAQGRQSEPLVISKQGIIRLIVQQHPDWKLEPIGGGDYRIVDRKTKVIGTVSELQRRMHQAMKMDRDPTDSYLREIAGATGLRITNVDYLWARSIAKEAEDFAKLVEKARATYAARASFADSEKFFDEMDAMFRKAMGGDLTARGALLILAGLDGAQVRGGIVMPPDVVQEIYALMGKSPPAGAPSGADFWFAGGTPSQDPDVPNLATTDGSFANRSF